MKIGVFDSGIGGLNVLKNIIEKYPQHEYLYFGDTIHLPYGDKSKEELLAYATSIISFFEKEKVNLIIIACGTCSNFKEELATYTTIPIVDCITPTIDLVKKQYRKVALLATAATISNQVFTSRLTQYGINVVPIACQSFVPLLEAGRKEEIQVMDYLKEIPSDTEAIILGCTHYPLLKDKIAACVSYPQIDMGKCMCESLQLTNPSKFKLTIYYSKIDDILLNNTEAILPFPKTIQLYTE